MATTALTPIKFLGSSLDDLRGFPDSARKEAGYQLDRIQHGEEPDDWKPFKTAGKGVRELRIWESEGTFRVIYLATFKDAVYVLHAFQKKDEQTRETDVALAAKRYRDLMKGRKL